MRAKRSTFASCIFLHLLLLSFVLMNLKQKIIAGETLHGSWINLGSTVSAEIMGNAGFDWVLIDLEHGLGPERRFAYEEGIRSPFIARYPKRIKPGKRIRELVVCQDIAPTMIALAGGRPGSQVQGRSLLPLLAGERAGWRKSLLVEYWAENALPWLVGMTYKAVRTDRYKYIHWINRDDGRGSLDELYDLDNDPYELRNLVRSRALAPVRERLRKELRKLTVEALGL